MSSRRVIARQSHASAQATVFSYSLLRSRHWPKPSGGAFDAPAKRDGLEAAPFWEATPARFLLLGLGGGVQFHAELFAGHAPGLALVGRVSGETLQGRIALGDSPHHRACFYDGFLPALGFCATRSGEGWFTYFVEGDEKMAPFICLDETPSHRGNANRFAFWADSEEEVNRLGEAIVKAGARVVEGPEDCADYPPGYYAVFFEDTDGNKWEIYCRNVRVR